MGWKIFVQYTFWGKKYKLDSSTKASRNPHLRLLPDF